MDQLELGKSEAASKSRTSCKSRTDLAVSSVLILHGLSWDHIPVHTVWASKCYLTSFYPLHVVILLLTKKSIEMLTNFH